LTSNAGLLIVIALLLLMLRIGAVLSDRFRSFGQLGQCVRQSTGLALVSLARP